MNFISYLTVLPVLYTFFSNSFSGKCYVLVCVFKLDFRLFCYDNHNSNHYGTPQEFLLTSYILDYKYYAPRAYMSLSNGSDLELYSSFDPH